MRTALFVDIHNWYTVGQRKYPGKVVNYSAISEIIPFQRKIAWGRQSEDRASSFARILRGLKFDIRFGGNSYNVEMALEVAQMIERRAVDHLMIGSNYFETLHIHRYAWERGIDTTAVGFNIPEAFEQYSQVLELDENVLMDGGPPSEVFSGRPVEVVGA